MGLRPHPYSQPRWLAALVGKSERDCVSIPRGHFHGEHRMFMWVHASQLPKLHILLKEKGYLERMEVAPGYLSVLREASGKRATTT